MQRTCARCWPPVFRARRSRTHSRSALHSTRLGGLRMPLGSSCRVQRPMRLARSTCLYAATADYCTFKCDAQPVVQPTFDGLRPSSAQLNSNVEPVEKVPDATD